VLEQVGISSVIRLAAGWYRVTMSEAAPTTFYNVIGTANGRGGHPPGRDFSVAYDVAPTTTVFEYYTGPGGGAAAVGFIEDCARVDFAVIW
jgi:hypothetical protein